MFSVVRSSLTGDPLPQCNARTQWVKQNIANFGGNPQDITVDGQSAGGTSIAYHLVSKKSRVRGPAVFFHLLFVLLIYLVHQVHQYL